MPTVAAKRAREHSSETSSKERQEVEKTTEKEKKIESAHDPVNEKVLSWSETAARAGVITMVRGTAEDETGAAQTLTQKRKKKTPKEYRQDGPKIKENSEITAMAKKSLRKCFSLINQDLTKGKQASIGHKTCLF